jgi:zinc protease
MDIKESYMAISYPIPPILHEDLPFLEIASSILGEGESSRLKEELRNRKGLVTDIWSSLFAQKEGGLFVVYATFHGTDYKAVRQAIEAVIRKTAEGRIERWELRKAKNRLNASLAYEAETVQGRARQIGYFYSLTGRRDFLEWYVKRAHTATERDVKTVLERYLRRGGGDLVVLLPPTQNARAFGLENGLKIVMNKNGAGSFSFAMGFPGGLKEEDQGENGVFNLLSRMFLRGTKRSSSRQIAKAIDVLAGEITPFCGRNVFGLSGRFLAKDMEQAFKLLRQLIAESAFRQEELERVRREVLSELRQKKDDPLSFTFRCFEEAFYDGHPYARDPSGSESHVANIGLADLERYYREFVGPRGAVLAVSGDIDLERTERLLRRIFSSWNGNGALLRRTPYEPKEIPRTVKIARDLKQNHIVVGFKGVSLVQKERYAAEVLEAILSRMGGRFYKALREERPYAYALAFFNRMGFDTGEMGIYAATDKRLTEEVLRSIEEELDRLQHGLEEGEVEEAKRFLVGNHLIRMQSNETIAFRMCLDTLYGLSPDSFKDWPYHIKAVRKEEVESLIRTHLRPSGAITVIVGEP